MIKEKGDKINLQIEKFMSKNTEMNAAFHNISKDVKAKIARDFNIKI
jgi:NC domain family